MGDVYHVMGMYGIIPPNECMPKAKEAALKALELEPHLAEAHTTLAMVSILFDRDWARARALFERCNELNPKYVQNRYWYAFWYIYLYEGKTNEALAESQKGIDIDPLAALPSIHYALVLWMERRNDEVIDLMEVIRKRDPIAYKSYWWLAACCYCDKGDYESALAVCPTVQQSLSRHQWFVAFHGHVLALSGRTDEAMLLQDELNRRLQTEYISNFSRAIIPMSLGDKTTTLDILKTTPETKDCAVILAHRWALFSPIHEDRQFKEIAAKEHLQSGSIGG
jgi:serine/threonine-protein kinase